MVTYLFMPGFLWAVFLLCLCAAGGCFGIDKYKITKDRGGHGLSLRICIQLLCCLGEQVVKSGLERLYLNLAFLGVFDLRQNDLEYAVLHLGGDLFNINLVG